MKKIILYIFILASMYSCMDRFENKEIIISNKSNDTIYSIISQSDTMFDLNKFKLKQRLRKGEKFQSIDITGLFISDGILPNTVKTVPRPMFWEDYFRSSRDKKIRIYLVKKSDVNKYGWIYIHKNNIFCKKNIYTFKDFENKQIKIYLKPNVSDTW